MLIRYKMRKARCMTSTVKVVWIRGGDGKIGFMNYIRDMLRAQLEFLTRLISHVKKSRKNLHS